MKLDPGIDIAQRVGADRVLVPAGALPQPAQRLDASPPVRPFEFELDVDRLCLDSTSHREISIGRGGDPGAMADRVLEIVNERGKMHNPETDSGGILVGTVTAVGERHPSAPTVGARVATLASLTVTPLRLETVTEIGPDSPQIGVTGAAYVCERAAWATMPDDLPADAALEVFDVCAAASHVRALTPAGATVCVLGAGHAGKLALAAARDAAPDGTLVAVDVDPDAVARALDLGLADLAVATDLRNPLAALEAVRAAGAPPADLTVLVVNAPGCEPAALLLTADEGSVLFFSMATSFAAAALAADGLSSGARMLIGSGFSPDGGDYALGLVRGSAGLRAALGIELGAAA